MAGFIKPSSSLNVDIVRDVELGNPFLRMKIFSLIGVEEKALTLEDVPQEYRPYPGCIFVSVWFRVLPQACLVVQPLLYCLVLLTVAGFSPGLFRAVLHHSTV